MISEELVLYCIKSTTKQHLHDITIGAKQQNSDFSIYGDSVP